MKSKKILSVTVIVLFVLAACKKDKTESPSVVGSWKGKYSNDVNEYPTNNTILLFRNNGTFRLYDGLDTSVVEHVDGTYTITGSALSCIYTINSLFDYWMTFDVNAKFTFMEGSWGAYPGTTSSGKLILSKQ